MLATIPTAPLLVAGVVVPIPTHPAVVMRIASAPLTSNAIGKYVPLPVLRPDAKPARAPATRNMPITEALVAADTMLMDCCATRLYADRSEFVPIPTGPARLIAPAPLTINVPEFT